MDTRFWLSAVVIFVLSVAFGFVVHAELLGEDYAKLTGLFRPHAEQQSLFACVLVAHALFALGFTWIYRQGIDRGKSFLGQGVRFGIAIAVLTTIPVYLIYYAVQPIPGAVVVKQIVLDVIVVVILGIVVAWLNQPKRV